ncbi:MAG: hypothetical protein DWQ29_15855 [Planctomycetota bacterium]|nr:MAG: hypothetical protein DWQ29_15855 [Planctomycetota bacterium]
MPANSSLAIEVQRLHPREVIRASAGTGKTYQLSSRYIAQLKRVAPDRILATTFTRKAAGEILERVLQRLAEACRDPHRRSELAASIGETELARQQCEELLSGLTSQLHRIRVGTLDSFFSRVAGAFSLELGLPPGWRLLDDLEDEQLRGRAIETVLREGDARDLTQLIHLLDKGRAGRGVTRLVRDTIDDLYDVYLDTDEHAWRAIDHPPLLSSEQLAQTIEALRAAPPPKDKRATKARNEDAERAQTGDWENFIGKGLAAKVLDGSLKYYGKPIEPPLLDCYQTLRDHAAAVLMSVLSEQLAASRDLLQRFDAAYRRLKRAAGGLTFDDITRSLAGEFSRRDPSGLSFRLDGQIDHLLLDEFQDTSLPQWRVLEPIAQAVTRESDASFFCVGDVKQAIYGWRGGVAEIFDRVTEQLPEVVATPLNTSFRSAPPVIETVNRTFADPGTFPILGELEPVFLDWVRDFPTHETHRVDKPGYAGLQVAPPPEPGEKPAAPVFRAAAAHVAELLPNLPRETSIGILARTNEAVGKMIYELQRKGIDASEEGGNRLTDSAAVQLVLSAIKLADHPGDTIARHHVATSPLASVLELAIGHDDADAAALAESLRRRLIDEGYGVVLNGWMHELAPHCNARELNRLRQLVALADSYDPLATLRPGDFIRFVKTQKVEDPRAAQVRVMTVHKAKGLEFDVVVLPELDGALTRTPRFVALRDDPTSPPVRVCRYRNKAVQQLMPGDIQTAVRQTAERALREALCVLYVSLTRAAHATYIFTSHKPASQSFSALLHAQLASGQRPEPNQLLFECGDPEWYRRLPQARPESETSPAAHDAIPHDEPVRIVFADPGGPRRRGREFVAPSKLAGGGTIKLRRRAAGSQARDKGTLIHAWLEQIEWLDRSPPAADDLRQTATRLGLQADLVEEARHQFDVLLDHPVLKSLLSKADYLQHAAPMVTAVAADQIELEVRNERRFETEIGGRVVSGSIDRLVLFHHNGAVVAADLLDYKTDLLTSQSPDAVKSFADRYRQQLSAYADVVSRIYSLPRDAVAARLVLLSVPQVVPIGRPT